MALFTVDGVEYPNIHVLSLKRNGEVLDGPNTGRLMTGEMIRDIIGTYYNYTVEIDSEDSSPAEYDSLYEVLTSPQASHNMVMPYGQTVLSFKAYVTKTEDELITQYGAWNRWGNLSFNMIAMVPARRPA